MGINLDTGAVTAVLKNRYTKKKIQTLSFQSPLFAAMPKDGEYGGNAYIGAIRTGTTTAVSSSDAIAFTTGSASSYQQWVGQWKEKYASANITGGAIDRAKGDPNAMVDALVGEFDGVFITLGISAGAALFNNGGGAIGQISTTSANPATSQTITLANPAQAINFLPNQIINGSATDGTSGTVATGSVTIAGVDLMAGTLTAVAANWSAITGVATGFYLFNQGDFGLGLIGLPGWIPPPNARPTAGDSFNGISRLSNPVLLAGNYYAGGGAPKRETLTQISVLVNRSGGRPNVLFCNPVDYADLLKEYQTSVVISEAAAFDAPQVSFPMVKIATAFGTISIMQDPFCPVGYAWLLNLDEWLMPSMGDVPKVLGQGVDGQDWLRVAASDAYQLRACYRASTYCAAPGHQGVVSW